MKTFLKTLARSTNGQDLIEYALLAGLISLTALFAVINVGTGVRAISSHRRGSVVWCTIRPRRPPSAMGYRLPCGSFMVDPMMANTVKQNITRNVYHIGRLSHDLAGGFLATMPGQKSFENPEIAKYVEKYHQANPEYETQERVKLGRYIENMTSVTTMVEAMHGAGSPQAQRIVMMSRADIEAKIKMAEEVIDGDSDVEGLPLPGSAGKRHATV